eukprot:gene904-985_t
MLLMSQAATPLPLPPLQAGRSLSPLSVAPQSSDLKLGGSQEIDLFKFNRANSKLPPISCGPVSPSGVNQLSRSPTLNDKLLSPLVPVSPAQSLRPLIIDTNPQWKVIIPRESPISGRNRVAEMRQMMKTVSPTDRDYQRQLSMRRQKSALNEIVIPVPNLV